jgi:predicted DNA-binding transcriptional regulator YafY
LLISGAVRQQRRLHLRYQSLEAETARSVDPYGIVSHWDQWYMVGWCHLRQALRVFRFDRIVTAELEEATFIRPPGFDSLAYVLNSLATTPRGWLVEIMLEMSLADLRQHIPPGSAVFEEIDSGVLMRFYSTNLHLSARYLFWLDCRFVIRRPHELRATVLAIAAEVTASVNRAEA